MKQRTLAVLILWTLGAMVGCTSSTPSQEPDDRSAKTMLAKAESLNPQSGQGSNLKAAFNENTDKVRLMVLLSPT